MSDIISYHHHHYVVPLARISLTLSHPFSLSFITSGRSSGIHPVSSQSCCMYVRAGCPAFARPYVGVHWSTSLMRSSLLLQQCPECLVRLTWIVFVMRGRWPYSCCLVGCLRQDLFNNTPIYLLILFIDWLIFNGKLTCLWLFYASKLGNRVYYIFIFIFLCSFLSFLKIVIWFKVFITNIDNFLTDQFHR